jgi:Tol biopolymer transport system component
MISPDGRYVSYVDWTTGNLTVCDLTTKTNWPVTKNTDPDLDGWNNDSAVSPDGKQIAYSWYTEEGPGYCDLRIIDLDGANPRVLYSDASVPWLLVYAWSPDGKDVLAWYWHAERNTAGENAGKPSGNAYLVLVSATDGSVRILRTWSGSRRPKTAVFSPDGRYVAYDFEQEDNSVRRDIFLIDLDRDEEMALIEHPANDRLSGWAPDGRRVVFASDRSSKSGLWMIDVVDGAPHGQPQTLLNQFDGWSKGITADGSFYYVVYTTASNVYVARLDSTGLNFEGEPELASSQFVGSTTTGDWSPDGTSLAYKTGSGVWGGPLVVRSAATSDERVVSQPKLFRPNRRMRGPRWSPDGQSLLVCASAQEGEYGLYTVNAETGVSTLLAIRDRRAGGAVWSPDGKSIYTCSWTSLRQLEVASGQETELYKGKGGMKCVDVSPDGRWLAFYQGLPLPSLVVMSSTGGEPREVVHLNENKAGNSLIHVFVRWTPDGEHLLLGKHKKELWKVHAETGEQQPIGPAIEGLVGAAMHPDGRQIAFTVLQEGSELWVMENFLPD